MADLNESKAPDTARMAASVDYDRHEARSGVVVAVTASVLIVLVVFVAGIYWLYTVSYEQVEFQQYTGVSSAELQAIHDREDEHLHLYTYVDKEKGVVRIPIDRAIDIVAREFAAGTVSYNTKSYPVKEEAPGGAAGSSNTPAAQPAQAASH